MFRSYEIIVKIVTFLKVTIKVINLVQQETLIFVILPIFF